jgi:hypothetical protein
VRGRTLSVAKNRNSIIGFFQVALSKVPQPSPLQPKRVVCLTTIDQRSAGRAALLGRRAGGNGSVHRVYRGVDRSRYNYFPVQGAAFWVHSDLLDSRAVPDSYV